MTWEQKQIGKCSLLLFNIFLQDMMWKTSDSGAYQLLSYVVQSGRSEHYNTVWHKATLLKVSLFVWGLLLNRLPTKDNLIYRGIIPQTSGLCSNGCGQDESAYYLFVGCAFYGSYWAHNRRWLDILMADMLLIFEHFHQFTNLACDSRKYVLLSM